MMRKTRIFLLSFILLLTFAALAFTLTSCGGSEITEIYVEKSNMPKLKYVEGQELDLKGGAITTVADGVRALIAMDGPDVTVSNYDKNKVGKQTVTLTYMGQSTTIEVEVVARMVFEGYEANYFVDDSFDNSKGKVRIARDDATTFTVNISDKTIEILDYDFSDAGTKAVRVKYTGTDGKSYEGSFDVTVHEIASVTFTEPTKKNYYSHDTALDLSGGYFTVKAAESTGFKKYVNITETMYSGFKPSLATMENRNNPLEQTVTFTYGGLVKEVVVKITYSNVSVVKELAEGLSSIDWGTMDLESITLSEEQGEDAVEAMTAYFKLSSSEKALISEETLLAVLRPAAFYAGYLYRNEVISMMDAFTLDQKGDIFLIPESYEAAVNAVARLDDSDDLINVYAELLRKMENNYADVIVLGEYKVSDVILINTEENVATSIDILNYMIKIYDYIDGFDNEWTIDTIKESKDSISRMLNNISVSRYTGVNYFSLYKTISAWRENNDFLEICFSYYCYVSETGAADIAKMFHLIPMPGELGEWYSWVYQGAYELQTIAYNSSTSAIYLYDTTSFMYYYFNALAAGERVKKSDSQLCRDLYDIIDGDMVVQTSLRNASYGYINNIGGALGNPAVEGVWRAYLEVFAAAKDTENPGAAISSKIEELFEAFVALTPAQQNAFISSLHIYYSSFAGSILVLDCKESARDVFTFLIGNYYLDKFSEEAKPIFYDVLIAIENYSLKNVKATAIEDFIAAMDDVLAAYKLLEGDDAAAFETYLGSWYKKYYAIYSSITEAPTLSDEDKAVLDELYDAILDFDRVYAFMSSINENSSDEDKARANAALPLLIALYERARSIYDGILCGDNDALRTALLSYDYSVTADGTSVGVTLDRLYNNMRTVFVMVMVQTPMYPSENVVYLAWDLYCDSGLSEFYALVGELLLSAFDGTLYEGGDIAEILAAFDLLSLDTKNYFFFFGTQSTFYPALETYFGSLVSEEVGELNFVRAVLNIHYYYCAMVVTGSEENTALFTEGMELAIAIYEAIEDKDSLPEELLDIYNAGLAAYAEICA